MGMLTISYSDAASRYGNDLTKRLTMDNGITHSAVLFDVNSPINGMRVLKKWYYYSTTGTDAPTVSTRM